MRRIMILLLSCYLLSGCVGKGAFENAIDSRVTGVETTVDKIGENLRTLSETKADTTTVAEEIGEVRNEINQTTQVAEKLIDWKKSIQAENIYNSGAGWVVLASIGMVVVFLGAGGLAIYWLLKKTASLKTLLKVVTCAVSKTPDEIQRMIKDKVKAETTPVVRQKLDAFVQTNGTEAKGDNDKTLG